MPLLIVYNDALRELASYPLADLTTANTRLQELQGATNNAVQYVLSQWSDGATTLNVPAGLSTAATVRLTPSTAIDPLTATNREMAAGSSIVSSRPEEAYSTVLTVPVASTWPCTR